MKKITQRVFAMVLALVMIVTSLPLSAFANPNNVIYLAQGSSKVLKADEIFGLANWAVVEGTDIVQLTYDNGSDNVITALKVGSAKVKATRIGIFERVQEFNIEVIIGDTIEEPVIDKNLAPVKSIFEIVDDKTNRAIKGARVEIDLFDAENKQTDTFTLETLNDKGIVSIQKSGYEYITRIKVTAAGYDEKTIKENVYIGLLEVGKQKKTTIRLTKSDAAIFEYGKTKVTVNDLTEGSTFEDAYDKFSKTQEGKEFLEYAEELNGDWYYKNKKVSNELKIDSEMTFKFKPSNIHLYHKLIWKEEVVATETQVVEKSKDYKEYVKKDLVLYKKNYNDNSNYNSIVKTTIDKYGLEVLEIKYAAKMIEINFVDEQGKKIENVSGLKIYEGLKENELEDLVTDEDKNAYLEAIFEDYELEIPEEIDGKHYVSKEVTLDNGSLKKQLDKVIINLKYADNYSVEVKHELVYDGEVVDDLTNDENNKAVIDTNDVTDDYLLQFSLEDKYKLAKDGIRFYKENKQLEFKYLAKNIVVKTSLQDIGVIKTEENYVNYLDVDLSSDMSDYLEENDLIKEVITYNGRTYSFTSFEKVNQSEEYVEIILNYEDTNKAFTLNFESADSELSIVNLNGDDENDTTLKTINGIEKFNVILKDSSENRIDNVTMTLLNDVTTKDGDVLKEGIVISELTIDGEVVANDLFKNKTFMPGTEINISVSVSDKVILRHYYEWFNKYYEIPGAASQIVNKEKDYKEYVYDNEIHFAGSSYGTVDKDGKIIVQENNLAQKEVVMKYWAKEFTFNYVDVDGNVLKEPTKVLKGFIDGELTEETEIKDLERYILSEYKEDIEIANNDEEVYTFKEAILVEIKAGNDPHKPIINLVFEKAYKNPVNIRHILYFKQKEVGTIKEEVRVLIPEKDPSVKEDQKAYVEKYAISDQNIAVLDEIHLKDNCIVYNEDTNTITFRYWARKINVNYVGYAKDNKIIDGFKPSETIYVNYVDFVDFDKNVDTYKNVKDNNGNLITSDVIYDNQKYVAEITEAKPIGKTYPGINGKQDENEVELTVTCRYDVKANCPHDEIEYEDKDEKSHTVKCECGYEYDESHTYEDHTCVCGRIEQGTVLSIKVDLLEGLKVVNNNEERTTLFDEFIIEKAYIIGDKLNSYEDTNGLVERYKERAYAEGATDVLDPKEDENDIIDAIYKALEDDSNLTYTEEGVVLSNVMYESSTENWYNLTITFKFVTKNFSEIVLNNTTHYKNTTDMIIRKLLKQENNDDIESYSITFNGLGKVQDIPYGKYEDVKVVFTTCHDEKIELIGNVLLQNTGSGVPSDNDNDNDDDDDNDLTIIDEEEVALSGGGIASLRSVRPNDNITRGEFTAIVAQEFEGTTSESYMPFNDIMANVNIEPIKKCSFFNIVKGYGNEEFGPNDNITREQLYLILSRVLKSKTNVTDLTEEEISLVLNEIADKEDISDWAKAGIALILKNGLDPEKNSNNLTPKNYISRTEAADKLEEFLKSLKEEENK